MSDFWFKAKVWTKLSLIVLVSLYVIIFAVENNASTADVWIWFFQVHHTTVLLLLLATFVSGVVVALLGRTILRTIHELKMLRKKATPLPLTPEPTPAVTEPPKP